MTTVVTSNPNTAIQQTPANGGAIQQAPRYANTLHAFLSREDVKAKLNEVAAKFMKPEDLVRLALMAASKTPQLLECSPESVLRALMDAAAVGIVPGGTNGRGYLTPRRNKTTKQLEACFDPGWRGLEDIAKRSGKITKIDAQVVYAADDFEVEFGSDPKVKHTPNIMAEDRGAIVAAYAIARYADGSEHIELLSRKDIDKIRSVSASQNGPWSTWYEEMARKSAVRRICKHLPVYDPIMEEALALATDPESGERANILPAALAPGNTAALEQALMGEPPPHDPATGEVAEEKAVQS